jgi:Mismatch repair ATPase (MutS family)
MDSIRKYFDLNNEDCLQRLNEQSCYDLNFDELFDYANYTHSVIGSQYLYNMMRCIPKENKVEAYEPWLQRYSQDEEVKTKFGSVLTKLNKSDAYDIYPLIEQDYIPYSKKAIHILRICQLLPALFLALYIITHIPLFIILTTVGFITNGIIHYQAKNISFLYAGSMPWLYSMIASAEKLWGIPLGKEVDPKIGETIKKVNRLKRKLSVFRFDAKLEGDLAVVFWAISELFKIFFLIDPLKLNSVFVLIRRDRESLRELFSFVGLVDSLQSIIALRESAPYYCIPQFKEEGGLTAEALYHPLIADCVPNSFSSNMQSFLVLGSNMSGKTSFIRTVGVNVLMAQTLNTAFAHQLALTHQKVYTSISMDDSLTEGQSYYLREVLRMKLILSETKTGHNLILLDELFKGTNTIERIAGAKAVLDYLASNEKNIILVATHDVELIELLSKRYTPIYFTENIEEEELSFNYKIDYEHNPEKNAIRILGLYGLPIEVVQDAMEISEQLTGWSKQ